MNVAQHRQAGDDTAAAAATAAAATDAATAAATATVPPSHAAPHSGTARGDRIEKTLTRLRKYTQHALWNTTSAVVNDR